MSWLGALAGGMENLLDRMDQAAGEALKDADDPGAVDHPHTRVDGLYVQDWPATTRPTAVVAASAYSSFSQVGQISPTPSSSHQRAPVCEQIIIIIVIEQMFNG